MAIHNSDGQSWLTKLECIGEKYQRIVFNNFGRLLNADMLKEELLWLNGKKAVGIPSYAKKWKTVSMFQSQNLSQKT